MILEEVNIVIEESTVQSTERTESIGGEEDLVREIVGHHDFGPVDHRSHNEGELMAADLKDIAFLDDVLLGGCGEGEELTEQRVYLRVANDGDIGVTQHELADSRGMVRLHVGDDEVIKASSSESVINVFKEYAADSLVNGVKENGLFIEHDIGVVADTVGNTVDTLKACKSSVICTDPYEVGRNVSCAIHEFNNLLFSVLPI